MMSSGFWAKCRAADMRRRTDRMPDNYGETIIEFADSTVEATLWLMKYHSDKLVEWFSYHQPGLEAEARERQNHEQN